MIEVDEHDENGFEKGSSLFFLKSQFQEQRSDHFDTELLENFDNFQGAHRREGRGWG